MNRRSLRSQQRGFTLVELSVVVIIVAVLATVGYVSYRRHVVTSRISEATDIVGNIRSAQTAYKSESGVYADISNDSASFYPAATPGAFASTWGGPCTNCATVDSWKLLNVQPDAPVMFGYATAAGIGGTDLTAEVSAAKATVASNTLESDVPPSSIGSTDPYYVVSAKGDVNGDGVSSLVVGTSESPALVVTTE